MLLFLYIIAFKNEDILNSWHYWYKFQNINKSILLKCLLNIINFKIRLHTPEM